MKRVLIIAYFFPPVSNMGSHRILRFVRHLPECGWKPVVLTGESPGWMQTDRQLLENVPANVTVRRVRSVDLTEAWKRLRRRPAAQTSGRASLQSHGLTTFLNRWVMIPDKYFPWIGPASRAAEQIIRELSIDAIYSTSDPLTDHLVARRAAQRTGVPWAAEFRDLWLGSPYFARAHPTGLHRALHARMERRVVGDATAVVALSGEIRAYFRKTYPRCRSEVLYNCFEPDDYGVAGKAPPKFTILYAGAMYSSRSPEPFFAGLRQFVERNGLTPSDAEFVLLGGSPDLDLRAMVERHNVAPFVRLEGPVSHADALRRMQTATVLLAIQSPEDTIHVPGKLFEYIGARRPVLAVSRPCEVAALVEQHHLGWVAEPQAEAVAGRLQDIYQTWKVRGHDGLAIAAAGEFGITTRTRQLAAILDSLR